MLANSSHTLKVSEKRTVEEAVGSSSKREGFSASERDFDRTGQIVRIRDGAKPSIFSFPLIYKE